MEMTTIKVRKVVRDKLKQRAKELNMSMSAYISYIVNILDKKESK